MDAYDNNFSDNRKCLCVFNFKDNLQGSHAKIKSSTNLRPLVIQAAVSYLIVI